MLYDGAIKNIRLAEISLADKNLEDVNKYIKKAQDIISEFMRTLDFDAAGDMAKSLYSLYEYMYQRLVKANTTKDAEPMIEVRKYLEELKAAWAQI